ncbi:hypothetical protein ABDD95_12445 [Mucilaginibacter sp. PAMB04274]|uniref:hypothetical protein n=1 Tax=Mucilaginibacter sp. PAMB04274 TaxID=3138568 RepID=UPI0031F604E3
MEINAIYNRFESIVERMLKAYDFVITSHVFQRTEDRTFEIDFVIERNQFKTLVEIKFYRSKTGVTSAIRDAAKRLILLLAARNSGESGLLIITGYASNELKRELARNSIIVWDRSDLYNLIKLGVSDSRLFEDFEQLLNETKQGIDTEDVFADVELDLRFPVDYFDDLRRPFKEFPLGFEQLPLKNYCAELNAIAGGRPGWREYELKCIEILKYLFSQDLDNWNTQHTTDDELSRFDMVCRIVSQNDFWKSLVQSFQSRYVLFEFKNYIDAIGQDQIYTTERYLYLRGLRSVGFVIAKNGGKPQALKAAKGALREHGKLIIILDNNDLCKMVDMKVEGKIPSDYLSQKLDDFLISLSR